MKTHDETISWKLSKNDVSIDVSMDIKISKCTSKTVVLIVPGVGGSVDGYLSKYDRMAEYIANSQSKGVVQISNHFITSFHWEENVRRAIDYIKSNAKEYFSHDEVMIEVIAHSAGASVVASIAWEYPEVTKLLLINMAQELRPDDIISGLIKRPSNTLIVYGTGDPSYLFKHTLNDKIPSLTFLDIASADHHFTGDLINIFIQLPKYLLPA